MGINERLEAELHDKVEEIQARAIIETLEEEEGKMDDNWEHRSANMGCDNCMWFVGKRQRMQKEGDFFKIGRCRRHAPTMSGWPVMFANDWCGDHKLDENKV